MQKLALIIVLSLVMVVLPSASALGNSSPCSFKTEISSKVQIVLNGELDEDQIKGVCAGVVDAQELFDSYGVDMPSANIYVFADRSKAINKLASLTSSTYARSAWTSRTGGFAVGDNVIIGMETTYWRSFRDTIIHELTHVLQGGLNGATWLMEGSADYMISLASERRDEWDIGKRRGIFGEHLYRLLKGDVSLKPMESSSVFRGTEQGYSISYVGFDLLISESENGVEDYLSCYLQEKVVTSWKNAFETCFGLTLDAFYDSFDEYQAVGFKELPVVRREREREVHLQALEDCRLRAVKVGIYQLYALC